MGKNGGGKPADTILTLEDALMRFKRQRGEAGVETRVEGGSPGTPPTSVMVVRSSDTVNTVERTVVPLTFWVRRKV